MRGDHSLQTMLRRRFRAATSAAVSDGKKDFIKLKQGITELSGAAQMLTQRIADDFTLVGVLPLNGLLKLGVKGGRHP
jgi:hypothetical protein